MNRELKKKLGVLAVLGLALLVGGTFAFTAFNQQATNDRLRENRADVGGRVHDYYNRDTENKDVFVENYGEAPIMARIRLSEFMEIQEQGQTTFEPVVGNTERDELDTWTTYIPTSENLNARAGDSAAFNRYSNLTFGWTRNGQTAPWYLPTFNQDSDDPRTAAAGHARDYAEDGATHPGSGIDDYWFEGHGYDNSAGTWPGSALIRESVQNLAQERAPMTIEQWENDLNREEKIGDFWVIDQDTGWAYWASELEAGETTSYLIDPAQMTEEAHDIIGAYYYGIHVESQLISPREVFQDEPTEGHGGSLGRLLRGIRNNAIDEDDDNGGTLPGENPDAAEPSPVSAFNFNLMHPGRLFTTSDGQQFRYLEDMGEGNHLIIRNTPTTNVSQAAQDNRINTWFNEEITADLRAIVQPVANTFTTGVVGDGQVTFTGGERWLPTNLTGSVAEDVTEIVQGEAGHPRAFALSLADVTRLSGAGRGFANHAQRGAGQGWWLRTSGLTVTPGPGRLGWYIGQNGNLLGSAPAGHAVMGARPALIIHQATE